MWSGPGPQCVHASLQRPSRAPAAAHAAHAVHAAHAAVAPTLSGSISTRRPPRPHPPSPSLVAKIDSSVACLWLLTPLSAGTAALAALVAVTTNHWLLTEENLPNPAFNGTGDNFHLALLTVSGLWRMCHTEPGGSVFRCRDIPYFPLTQYTPDPSDSSTAIPYIVTQSAVPLLLAVVGQAVGCVCCALGHCAKGRRLCTFVAGVIFIVSGLIMLTGIIMYISAFKSEVGYKLHYVSLFDAPRMSYSYGYSFGLYLSGFVGAELAGTLAIFLFLQWYQKDWVIELTERAKAECRAWDREFAFTERDGASLLERRLVKRENYPPTASASATPRERRRFFFDADVEGQPCSVHRRTNQNSASLKDLSSSTLYGFPAAPRPTEQFFEEFKEIPHSANTLSGLRSASIFQSQASMASGRFVDGSSQAATREEELVTFTVGAREAAASGARRERGETFRRTTPV